MYFQSPPLKKRFSLKLLLILISVLVPFVSKAQTPTSFVTTGTSPAYVYVGSLTESTTNSGNCQKLKIDIFGGGWYSNTDGETIFYIGNRGGLTINEVTTGSATIGANFTLHAYQNGNNTDFYLLTPSADFSALSVLSYFFAGYEGTSQFVTITSSATAPAETEILPLTITPVMTTDASGNIAVNSSTTFSPYKFAVNGQLIATAAYVKLYNNWPDYVFKEDYRLPTLQEVKTYIDQNHRLPEMPSEDQIRKDGLNLGEMNKLLAKKVEELTLYLIEKDKQEKEQEKINQENKNRIDKLEQELNALLKQK